MAKKKKTLYKKALLIYTLIIILLIAALLIYVASCVKEYEKYDLENYIKASVSDLTVKDLDKIINLSNIKISKYEKHKSKNAILKGIDKSLEDSDKITYKKSSLSKDDKKPIYDVYYDDKLVLTLYMKNNGNVQKIKLLNYTLWSVTKVESHITEALYTLKAEIPVGYKFYVNNKEVTESKESENKVLSLFSKYADIGEYKYYEVPNLIENPKYEIRDTNNNGVNMKIEDGVIKIFENRFTTNDEKEAMKELVKPFDVLSFSEKYSLFLTKDLSGAENGFSTLKTYVIEGTEMYKMMYDWAHGIDITFTSKHTLKNPAFTNEKLSNFVIYSKKAFQVDVMLEKNMVVNGNTQVMKMNDTLSFVYYNDGWKLINMESK